MGPAEHQDWIVKPILTILYCYMPSIYMFRRKKPFPDSDFGLNFVMCLDFPSRRNKNYRSAPELYVDGFLEIFLMIGP